LTITTDSPPPTRASDPDERDRPADREPEDEGDGGRMSFLEHLDELRKRLLISVAALVVGFVICLTFVGEIYTFIMRPLQEALPPGGEFIYTEPTEAFFLYMKMAALGGLVLATPVILWQLWAFVAPGLYSHEKRYAIPFVVLATAFFTGGALFSHAIAFPWTWKFFASFGAGSRYLEFVPRIGPVFALYTKMLIAFGLVFQMPTVVYFLARLGLVTARFLLRQTKYAVLIIFIAAAVLSPGPDVVSQAVMAAPMILLYLVSIAIAWVFERRPPSA
jgi:sec-independent protein translocase protein TatC